MSRRKLKTYIAVIGVGLGALIVDRLLEPGGTPASALGAASQSDDATEAAAREPELAAALSVMPTAFPSTLPGLVPNALLRDPFDLPEAARRVLESKPEVAPAKAGNTVTPSELFRGDHELSAIVRVGASRVAIVDGLMIAQGQRVDECSLEELSDRYARFSCADGDVVLTIAPRSLGLPDAD